ncbi:hypothetical protein AB0H37_23850 [Actinomadura sp. NPDC023710]|uniref:hypothetical protein n=1 Tax=Actinomadura sp. NPDC023710 TaxID=3158219 RepID=UPI003408F003
MTELLILLVILGPGGVLFALLLFREEIAGWVERRCRRDKDDLFRILASARSGRWTVMMVDIDPEQAYRLDPLARGHVQEIAMKRLTRLHSHRRVFDIGEGKYFVLVEWKIRATPEREGRDLAQRTSDALTADLNSGFSGLPAVIGYAEGALPRNLIKPAADATRRAAIQPAYDCALPIVRPNARIEQDRAETTSID